MSYFMVRGVGRLNWGRIREGVSLLRFQGYHVEHREGSGWVARDFHFKGEPQALDQIKKYFAYLADLDKRDAGRRS